MKQITKQIGNAVPVQMAAALGREIVKAEKRRCAEARPAAAFNGIQNGVREVKPKEEVAASYGPKVRWLANAWNQTDHVA